MATEPLTAHIHEAGASAFAVSIRVSGHRLTGDEPVADGGGNLGPAPMDLLTAALGECTCMTIRWVARQKGWPLEHVAVIVTHRKGGEGASSPRQDVFEKTITLKAPDLSAGQQQELIAAAAKCPIQRTLEGTPLIRTTAET
jgi:putative redox protein